MNRPSQRFATTKATKAHEDKESEATAADFGERVRANQKRLTSELKPR